MSECTQCPHKVGDSYERDCCFPDCMGWWIEKNVKPIPDRNHDYDFGHEDDDIDRGLHGTAPSVLDAMEQIKEIEFELSSECKRGNNDH